VRTEAALKLAEAQADAAVADEDMK
jgi:hypothetical protein